MFFFILTNIIFLEFTFINETWIWFKYFIYLKRLINKSGWCEVKGGEIIFTFVSEVKRGMCVMCSLSDAYVEWQDGETTEHSLINVMQYTYITFFLTIHI